MTLAQVFTTSQSCSSSVLFLLLPASSVFGVFPQSVREQDVRALILVPTKELGHQVQAMMRQLTAFCSRDVRVADISGKADLSAQRSVCSGAVVDVKVRFRSVKLSDDVLYRVWTDLS